jgi:DNA-binding Lrp family transcriptional regulator
MIMLKKTKLGMDATDQHLLNEMQDRFPLVPEPYAELAERVGVSEEEVLERLLRLRASGVLRQVSPIFDK